MESPDSGKTAEHVIATALARWENLRRAGITGLSPAKLIADALRDAGLLREDGPGS